MSRLWDPPTYNEIVPLVPVPLPESGRLKRKSMEFAGAVSVNSTYWPWPDSVTALRPDASPASVPAARFGPMTDPFVAAFSASCSRNGTVAPRPAARAELSAGTAAIVRAAAAVTAAARAPNRALSRVLGALKTELGDMGSTGLSAAGGDLCDRDHTNREQESAIVERTYANLRQKLTTALDA
jgi:hypothetical protein